MDRKPFSGVSGVRGLLGLGSNVGERRTNLQAAVDALPARGVRVLASSSTYDTDPVGEVLDQPSFLNACVLVETQLAPLDLLDAVKEIERRLGRRPAVRHGPRSIDIDVLLLGDEQVQHPRMRLPHEIGEGHRPIRGPEMGPRTLFRSHLPEHRLNK